MPFTHGHTLVNGVGSYQYEPGLNVPITAADAQVVVTALRDSRYCGYPDAQVTLLTHVGATLPASWRPLPPPPALLETAFEATRAIKRETARARALAALAPHLPPELLAAALAAACAIADVDVRIVFRHLKGIDPGHPQLMGADVRPQALAALALRLPNRLPTMIRFAPMLRILARRGRLALLRDLAALAPWLAALAERR